MSITDDKNALRTVIKNKIKDYLKNGNRGIDSLAICKKVRAMKEYQEADVFLAYIPLKTEADCLPLIADALESGKTVAVPRCKNDGAMEFYILWKNIPLSQQLLPGSYGILEPVNNLDVFDIDFPVPSSAGTESFAEKIFMLFPALAFTKDGKRLGKGKGYYDRYVERMVQGGLSPFKCGFCFSFQLVEDIPTDIYDKNVDVVVST